MRLVLLLVVLTAVGFAATRALKTSVPTVPVAGAPSTGAPVAGEPATPAEAVRKFEKEVNDLVQGAAAERDRQLEEASR